MNSEPAPSSMEDSDVVVSPEIGRDSSPEPGLNGYDADRTEPYTKITPFQEKHDTSIEFFYKPLTLSALSAGLITLAYVATTQDVLEEGLDKRRV